MGTFPFRLFVLLVLFLGYIVGYIIGYFKGKGKNNYLLYLNIFILNIEDKIIS
jgi:ABC-type dipeptide/oligopeptide/nickel transport system permease subunit